MRMRKKPNLVPRMERCARFLIQAPEEQRGHWRELKPDAEQIWLELGCGKGRFTAETAAQNPNVLYLAVERVPDAMIVAMERCAQRSLTNVFFVDGDAARLREYFAPDEVDRLFINFCDPWPSNRHARRRLTHQNFLVLYRGVLCTGGQIHFKTDNRDLFEYSLFQFPKAGYALSEVTRDLHANGIRGVMTTMRKNSTISAPRSTAVWGRRRPWTRSRSIFPFPARTPVRRWDPRKRSRQKVEDIKSRQRRPVPVVRGGAFSFYAASAGASG